ncbi:MAG: hypothetical protein HYV63_19665 [Candidatus Schekmanbacteria bacterium]|nr:hypothetical protein [Candidatus Schekmanbacteria bacterium]
MRRFTIISLGASFLVTIMAGSALARSRPVSLEEMPATAQRVVVGELASVSTRWDDKHIMVWTDYTFTTADQWSGRPVGTTFIVSVAGGEVGNEARYVSDVPSFFQDQQYVLFLHGNEHKYHSPVIGEWQGAFTVARDDDTGDEVLVGLDGKRLDRFADGTLGRGPQMQPVPGEPRTVRRATDAGHAPATPEIRPIVRDAAGNVVSQDGAVFAPKERRPEGEPVTLAELKSFVENHLNP